ncbi:rCG42960, isoform CRA_d [Rattus norvegicus]|uniref:RCG42960, isoform CRA_d n=1 Tax=Rattus norvegicus TaxID=10116 RepID=A6IW06_RAT|nr:rCG42960, isoform CRA_d [Rattus norvegicus]
MHKPRISGFYLFQGQREDTATLCTFAPLPRLDPEVSLPGLTRALSVLLSLG